MEFEDIFQYVPTQFSTCIYRIVKRNFLFPADNNLYFLLLSFG